MNKLNEFKQYITNRNIILAAFSLLMIIGLVFSITLSKYKSIEEIESRGMIEQFYALARLYYTKDGETTRSEAKIDDNGYIELTPKEFETLTVDVEYTGKARTYCRFKMDCSWLRKVSETYMDQNGRTVTNEYFELVPHSYPKFTCGDEIYSDNVEKDGYLYFKDILESEDGVTETYHVITKVTKKGNDVEDLIDPERDKSERVRVRLTVDCVQYNRVSELWKINKLPWW